MTMGGRDVVMCGDPKQAFPIGDDPLFRMGDYTGKGQNKPKGAERTPDDAWNTHRLHRMGMMVRDGFDDVCILREVHRYVDAKAEIPDELRDEYARDAMRFLRVTRGMADCDPEKFTKEDHQWLSRRNRSLLQQTEAGREQLRRFDGREDGKLAPLLMDGRKDTVKGGVGADTINQLKLYRLSAEKKKPIAPLKAYHDKPKGYKDMPDQMDADDFRGIQNELLVCEGARVLLTQNLWVEAGLMNGALGHVVGYMWPEGGNPHSTKATLRSPLCVFVEFDDVNLGTDARGVPRSFFPDDPVRKNWIPIFRQRVTSTVEEHVWRENYPLQLAWAMTHWKAQGMTLDRVRVHLSDRSAAIPGIAFVACTRVRHPWDLVFEEDLPEYEHFMKARRTPAFRERRRYELRCEARASRTLRRYGYCEADLWTAAERTDADALIAQLHATRAMRKDAMRGSADADTWLWGDGEPDYEGELVKAVRHLAGADGLRNAALRRVADRLLDRSRVRTATADERAMAEELLDGVDLSDAGLVDEEGWRLRLCERAHEIAKGDGQRSVGLRAAAHAVAGNMVRHRGSPEKWTVEVEDDHVPVELRPLHMSAVREALGALIPDHLHKTLDAAVKRGKDDFGAVRGGAVLRMDKWTVNVRAEDALARGRLEEEVLEFFLKILQHVAKMLDLPVAIGSKTVGKYIGQQEGPENLHRVMQAWRAVWDREEVRRREQLVLPVALDDRQRDWVMVVVRSCADGQKLGEARRLRVAVYDAMRRTAAANRVARNVDVLIRGLGARQDPELPIVEAMVVPEIPVASQRILYAFGRLVGHVAALGGEDPFDFSHDSFLSNVSLAARALFAYLRRELAERGARDVEVILKDADMCRVVLKKFVRAPSLLQTDESAGQRSGDRDGAGAGTGGGGGGGVGSAAVRGLAWGQTSYAAGGRARYGDVRALRVATWNIADGADGLLSAQAPPKYSMLDKRTRVMREVERWGSVFGCDVLALQECATSQGYAELLHAYVLIGTAEATANRGHVHLYVRRCDGFEFQRVELGAEEPCVAVRLCYGAGAGAAARAVFVVAVHLPVGREAQKKALIQRVLDGLGEDRDRVVLVGDMNVNQNAELNALCEDLGVKDGFYTGCTWGTSENRFFADVAYKGPGLRKDRVLFGKRTWAHVHRVGLCAEYFDGQKFYLSDHFGLMAYVDCDDCYGSRTHQNIAAAKVRRGQLAYLMEQNQQKELVEVKESGQRGREEQALARRRAQERDQAEFRRAQQRGGRQRRDRLERLRQAAFGATGLFGGDVVTEAAAGGQIPLAPAQIAIPNLGDVQAGSFADSEALALRGMRRVGFTCYVVTAAQVLLRTPGVREWLHEHAAVCAGQCAVCSLADTSGQMVSGFGPVRNRVQPFFAVQRARVGAYFGDARQHDVVEFVEAFLARARDCDRAAGRYDTWGHVQLSDSPVATHADRLFGFVREERLQCRRCHGAVRTKYIRDFVLRVQPKRLEGGPMTVAEMYLEACAKERVETLCEGRCQASTEHDKQSRMVTTPNVLIVQVQRNPVGAGSSERDAALAAGSTDVIGEGRLVREAVSVEERLTLHGGTEMELVGVVYHNGPTINSGHYTCLCRGPRGHFWSFDDDRYVEKMDREVAHIKASQVYMVVYAKRRQEFASGVGATVVDGGDLDGAPGVGDGSAGSRASDTGGQADGELGADTRGGSTGDAQGTSGAASGVGGSGGGGGDATPAAGSDAGAAAALVVATDPSDERGVRRRVGQQLNRNRPLRRHGALDVDPDEVLPLAFGGMVLSDVEADGVVGDPAVRVRRTLQRSDSDIVLDHADEVLATRLERSSMTRGVSVTPAAAPGAVDPSPEQERSVPSAAGSRYGPDPEATVPRRRSSRIAARTRDVAGYVAAGAQASGVGALVDATGDGHSVDPSGVRCEGAAIGETRARGRGRGRGRAGGVSSSRHSGGRIVTGFGLARIDDVVADEQRRVNEGARRGDQRREAGTRGRMTTYSGEDLDRSAGGAWRSGRR